MIYSHVREWVDGKMHAHCELRSGRPSPVTEDTVNATDKQIQEHGRLTISSSHHQNFQMKVKQLCTKLCRVTDHLVTDDETKEAIKDSLSSHCIL